MSIYSKNLSGLNQKVIVGTATYTDDTTFEAFINNAPNGEVGVFLESGAVRTTALTAGLRFFIAQKRDGVVNKTPILAFDDIFRRQRQAYDAPVRQVTTLGFNGTTGDLGFGGFSGASLTNTLQFGVVVRETTPGNQPFPIQEAYVTVNSATADEYTVAASLVSQLNADFDYQRVESDRFVIAEITANGAKTNLTNNTTVTNGSVSVASTAHGRSVGNLVAFRDSVYRVAQVVDANNFRIDRPYQGVSEVITAGANSAAIAYTSGTTLLGIRFTGISIDTHFRVSGSLGLQFDPVTTITAWKLGSGYPAAIRELEATEGIIFDGVGSTRNVAFREDYGQPTLISSLATNYDQIFLDFAPRVLPSAALPVYEQRQIQRVLIAAPNGGTLNSTLQTVFGV